MLDDAAEVHLFLTHYHLDHVCGLAYLPGIFAGAQADRPRALARRSPASTPSDALAELIRPPYNPRPWAEIDGKLTVATVEPRERTT